MWEDNLWNEMKRMRKRMNNMFSSSEFPRKTVEIGPINYRQAWTNLNQDEYSYKIEVEIPGIKKENVKIELVDDNLTIRAERKQETEDNTEDEESDDQIYRYRTDKSYAGFYRTIRLPKDVEINKIDAEHKDGILRISIPKQKKAKKKKFVDVK